MGYLDTDKEYYRRSFDKIWESLKEQQEEIAKVKEENIKLHEQLKQENKELKGRIIRLESTLNK